ncbi:hypothetical protein AVEN_45225-1 [Araneus ventricosus]|uniref:Uncharacterized protein n=1 Tax=Araneus ventricosus TaxID=182803 RepID=A0A4Y2X311_ARAVE|nr:hypothetical protein AVEN_45225-1 [Araneus ventricosus]
MVYRTKLTALLDAVNKATRNSNQKSTIRVNDKSIIMATSLTKTTIGMKRNIFRIRHENSKINGTWLKAHVESMGIEKNDQLTKAAIEVEQSYIKLPNILTENRVRKDMLGGGTGRSVYNIIPMVSPLSTNWLRNISSSFRSMSRSPSSNWHTATSAYAVVL